MKKQPPADRIVFRIKISATMSVIQITLTPARLSIQIVSETVMMILIIVP